MNLFSHRDAQDVPPIAYCHICDGEIYAYDQCEVDISGFVYCEQCSKEYPGDFRSVMIGRDLIDDWRI